MGSYRGRPTAIPEGYRGSVLVQDVVDLIADIGSGDYDRDELYEQYMALVALRGRVGGNATAFGQVLSELKCERRHVWRIP